MAKMTPETIACLQRLAEKQGIDLVGYPVPPIGHDHMLWDDPQTDEEQGVDLASYPVVGA